MQNKADWRHIQENNRQKDGMEERMKSKQRKEILDYIYAKYLGQEVIEALRTECPSMIQTVMPNICEYCNKTFKPRYGCIEYYLNGKSHKFCSISCINKAWINNSFKTWR